jgi:3-phenylpropionate/trans-cinnamate dioxygenase ferredoxin reductase subunit
MSAQQTFVIVGAGLAGAKAAEALRTNGFDGTVILLGEEADRPYDRPPLSKDYLQGKYEKDKIYIHPADWYAEHHVDLRLRSRVTAIDRAARLVSTADGQRIGYDKLLLATGSTPRRLPVPGAELSGVHYLRRVGDCDALKAALACAQHVAIIGAGWIGLETAAAARAAGCQVTVIARSELPLLTVLGAEVAATYAALHRNHGVDLRLNSAVHQIAGETGKVTGVRLADGAVVAADTVIVGVGIAPNTELAEAAGLRVDNGIFVDEHLATTDPDVFAAGDVANSYYPLLGTHPRLEHWSAALHQGPVAAANMMGRNLSYDRVPYFFSDQYDSIPATRNRRLHGHLTPRSRTDRRTRAGRRIRDGHLHRPVATVAHSAARCPKSAPTHQRSDRGHSLGSRGRGLCTGRPDRRRARHRSL